MNLDPCYQDGDGLTEDKVQAAVWFRRAAEQGHARAQYKLGRCYFDGEGVPQDEQEAVHWFSKAAEQGHASAQYMVSYYGFSGGGLEDNVAAAKWLFQAAQQGLAEAQNRLGLCYDYGNGVAEDKEEAVKWYRKAADQGHPQAQYNLGCSYSRGEGVSQDAVKAANWFRKAAEQGDARAQHSLGSCYENGEGVPLNKSEAAKWYRKAAEQGYPEDQDRSEHAFANGICQRCGCSEAAVGNFGWPCNEEPRTNTKSNLQSDVGRQELSAGQILANRYQLVRALGEGGMGVVWLARDIKLERDVALKFLPQAVMYDRREMAHLKKETQRCLNLTHPNIVRVHDLVEDDTRSRIFISMEYVDGDNLHNLRADLEHECLEVDEVFVNLTAQLCNGLIYAHERGMIHRDLKPSNLLINRNLELKISDFGIARSLADSMSRVTGSENAVSGTLPYMSPQQALGEPSTQLDDIYSLGATIYDLLTGQPPFFTGNVSEQIRMVAPLSITQRRIEFGNRNGKPIPAKWEKAVLRCLAKDPALRPQSVFEVAKLLEVWE